MMYIFTSNMIVFIILYGQPESSQPYCRSRYNHCEDNTSKTEMI